VGHHEPNREHEAHPDIGNEHVAGVDQTQQHHAHAWDILAQSVEDEDGNRKHEGQEDGAGAEEGCAKDCHHQ